MYLPRPFAITRTWTYYRLRIEKPNGYREYREVDVDRLKLVAGARCLDFSLAEISEIIDLRDRQIAPCGVLLDLLNQKSEEISQRIAELQRVQGSGVAVFCWTNFPD